MKFKQNTIQDPPKSLFEKKISVFVIVCTFLFWLPILRSTSSANPTKVQLTSSGKDTASSHAEPQTAMGKKANGGGKILPPVGNPTQSVPGDTSLHSAIRQNDRLALEKLLSMSDTYFDAINTRYQTPLAVAILTGQEDIARQLIEKGVELNPQYPIPACMTKKRPPAGGALMLRSGYSNLKTVDIDKVEKGSSEECLGKYFFPPSQYLNLAIKTNNEPLAFYLLNKGENSFRHDQSTCLDNVKTALAKDFYNLAERILSEVDDGWRKNIIKDLSHSVINYSSTLKRGLIEFLMKHGVDNLLESVDWQGYTLLMRAARKGDIEAVTFLLDLGAAIDTQYLPEKHFAEEGGTALMIALAGTRNPTESERKGQFEVARLLITRGVDLNHRNKQGVPATFYLTGRSIPLELVEFSFEHGADKSIEDGYINELLKRALSNARFDIAKFLIDKGADINDAKIGILEYIQYGSAASVDFLLANHYDLNRGRKQRFGSRLTTPLIYACQRGKAEFVTKFVKVDADVNLADSSGNTPLFAAIASGKEEIVRILLDASADVNLVNSHGSPPLFSAIAAEKLEIVKILVEAGADVNYQSKDRNNSFLLASSRGQKEIADYLKSQGADTKGWITTPRTLALLKKTGLIPDDADGISTGNLKLFLAMLKEEYGLSSLEKLNKPDPRFSSPEKTWQNYKKALLEGDLQLAAMCHLPRSHHIEFYKEIGPEKTKEIAKDFRPIEKITGDDKRVKYRIKRLQFGKDITYYIYFTNVFGEWKIEQF